MLSGLAQSNETANGIGGFGLWALGGGDKQSANVVTLAVPLYEQRDKLTGAAQASLLADPDPPQKSFVNNKAEQVMTTTRTLGTFLNL